jgi:hypothetical protein
MERSPPQQVGGAGELLRARVTTTTTTTTTAMAEADAASAEIAVAFPDTVENTCDPSLAQL